MDNKGTILIIDDEEGIRKGCTRVLQPAGYLIDLAPSFQDGLKKVQSGHYDLVLLDVMMPDGKGIDLLEPIHTSDPDTVAVLITGYATVELAVDAIKRGAYDFISKPFTAQLLLMTVAQGLEKRRLSLESRRLQQVEKQLAELEFARQQAERLSEFKSAFATTVAHELRSPVGAAQTLVRTLLRGLAGDLNPKQAELLGRVEVRLDDLLALVNDLLTLAASKSIVSDKPLQPVKLNAVVQSVVQSCQDDAVAKQVALQYTPPSQDITVAATDDGMATILSNLVNNAIKYTPSHGSIRLDLWQQDGCAALSVADTGIGIPADDIPHIGEEFFRAANVHGHSIQGTGLGLSIVKELVTRFAGQIHIDSREGQGTTITLRFPLCGGSSTS